MNWKPPFGHIQPSTSPLRPSSLIRQKERHYIEGCTQPSCKKIGFAEHFNCLGTLSLSTETLGSEVAANDARVYEA
jgi:hypothetical protein